MVAVLVHRFSFIFALSSDVGIGKANRPDDVEFVRFGLSCCRVWLSSAGLEGKPKHLDFFTAVAGLPMAGGMDQKLDRAIRGLQKSQELKVDGVVSAVSQITTESGKVYMYALLNRAMQVVHPNLFPRIDVVPESGLMVTLTVKSIFGDKILSDKPLIV